MIIPISEINPSTPITLTMSVAYSLVAGLIAVTWYAANMLRDVREQLKVLSAAMTETWSRIDHERWATDLERHNRGIGLAVPEVPKKQS